MQVIRAIMIGAVGLTIALAGCSEEKKSSKNEESESSSSSQGQESGTASGEGSESTSPAEEVDPEKAALELQLKAAEQRALLAETQTQAVVTEMEEMSAEDALRDKVIGIIVQNRCLRASNVKPERMGALQLEILDAMGMTGAEYAEARAGFKSTPGFREAVVEGMKSCPDFDPEDIVFSTEPVRKSDIREKDEEPSSEVSGALKGKLYGSANGTLMLTLTQGKVSSGTAVLPGRAFHIRGNLLKNGRLNLLSNQGKDTFRAFGKKQQNGVVSGNWIAHVDSKVKKGSFIVK
jgi:hypothetical protein